jgi:hypothetical protein
MIDTDLEGFKTPSRNIYFENGTLWSYGSHYPMAKKYQCLEGAMYREVILVNSRKSSQTTEKHKTKLRQARKPGQVVFGVPDIQDPQNPENIDKLLNDIVDNIDFLLGRSKYGDIKAVVTAIQYYDLYLECFKIKQKIKIPAEFLSDLALISKEKEEKREQAKKEKEERLKQARIERVRLKAEQVRLWLENKNTERISDQDHAFDYSLVRVNGDKVETTKGAKVPLEEAVNFAWALKNGRVEIGQKIGPFKVNAITPTFIHIGCHRININQALDAVLKKG